jgi:tRNA(adenine34) deaminase
MPVHPSKKSRSAANTRGKSGGRKRNRWVTKVTTDSTHPQKGLFTQDPAMIAGSLASKKVSPKGPASGMRMLTYFINRAGKGLSASRRAKLERAKTLLSACIRNAKQRRKQKTA